MFKKYRIPIIISSVITLLPVLAGLILWNKLPNQIPTSFNGSGITGYSSKAFAVFGVPTIVLGVHLLCTVLTLLDPRRKNIEGAPFAFVLWICPVTSLLVAFATYTASFGLKINQETVVTAMMSILFIILGFILPKCKQNYTMGIKLPWTLHSEENWNKTHALAGKLWIAGGILLFIFALLHWIYAYIAVILLLAIIPTIYSLALHIKTGE